MLGQEELDKLNEFLLAETTFPKLTIAANKILDEVKKCRERTRKIQARLAHLQTVLTELHGWLTEIDVDDLHPQTLSTLSIALICCRLLFADMHRRPPDPRIPFGLLAKLRRHRQARLLERQISVLVSLRETGDCKNILLQKVRLEAPKMRRDFRRIQRECGARNHSLDIHVDVQSFLAKLCERAFTKPQTSSMRRSSVSISSERRHSKHIDQCLRDEARSNRNECSGVVFCAGESGKERVLTQLEMSSPDSTARRIEYRGRLRLYMVQQAQRMVQQIRKTGIECGFDGCEQAFARIEGSTALDLPLAQAMTKIWKHPRMGRALEDDRVHHKLLCTCHGSLIAHYFDCISLIAAADYLPTDDDILQMKERLDSGIKHTKFPVGRVNVQVTVLGFTRGERRKWLHQMADTTFNVFAADLASYDRVLYTGEPPIQNRLLEARSQFDSIINSPKLRPGATILVLNNFDEFSEKLGSSPLRRFFPQYEGHSTSTAIRYIVREFLSANRGNRPVYPIVVQRDGTSCVRTFHALVQQIMLTKVARR